MKKKTLFTILLLVVMCICITTSTAYAAGSYSSTYNMTGGVFSKDITASQYITTTLTPSQGSPGAVIGVILATKHWYGWDGPVKDVDSAAGGSVTHYCNGTYKIWLRNFTTIRVYGNVSFDWK